MKKLVFNQTRKRLGTWVTGRISAVSDAFLGRQPNHGQPSRQVARRLLLRVLPVASGVSFVPGSALVLGGIEVALLVQIARIYNLKPNDINQTVILTQLGIRYGVSNAASWAAEGLQAIPVAGNIAKGIVGGSVVYGLGLAMIEYFERKYPGAVFEPETDPA